MSSRLGSDGYTNSQRKRMTGVLHTIIERDKEAIETMQRRLEELGAPRMLEEELDAKAAEATSEASALPQPKGRWRNGRFVLPEQTVVCDSRGHC